MRAHTTFKVEFNNTSRNNWKPLFDVNFSENSTKTIKAGFHMIADDRGSQIAESSAIVCDQMETHFCDRLRSCDRDRR